jgi:hypothetical protein
LDEPGKEFAVKSGTYRVNSKNHQNPMIFNDLQAERRAKCESYYVRGKDSNIDYFYLAQNFFKNVHFMYLFPQDLNNVYHICNGVSTDKHMAELESMAEQESLNTALRTTSNTCKTANIIFFCTEGSSVSHLYKVEC